MKVTLYNIQANFYQDASGAMGEMSPFLLFDGDDDAKMDKRGPHSGKTDVAKKAGAGPVNWDDRVELHLKGSMIKVQGKASKPLLPDKVLGEGQVQVSGGGREQCQLTDPKTGNVVGEVSFEVSQGGGMTGGGMGGGMMGGNQQQQGYGQQGGQGYNTAGQQGMGGQGMGQGQGYEQGRGQDYNSGMGGGQGMSGQSGQGYNTGNTGQMTMGGNQGYGNQQGTTGGMSGMGGGMGGGMGRPQEQFEKTTHNKHDHDESESHEQRTVR